jgi:putative transposase
MPRIARIVIPGLPHHITQRGNNRQDVFFVKDDYLTYLSILKEESERFGAKIMGYCLMTNHIHLIAIPTNMDSLRKGIGKTHWRYTQYINMLHGRSGHLWQNRFYSCALEEAHLIAAMAYIERNPVRTKMVNRAWQYRWSSANTHVNGKDENGLLDLRLWNTLIGSADWAEYLIRNDDKNMLLLLRSNTNRGRPLVSDTFVSKIEKIIGRRIRALPVGRPKKKGGEKK